LDLQLGRASAVDLSGFPELVLGTGGLPKTVRLPYPCEEGVLNAFVLVWFFFFTNVGKEHSLPTFYYSRGRVFCGVCGTNSYLIPFFDYIVPIQFVLTNSLSSNHF
jgi:hypothetical protein